jgi:hypothetical protein
VNRVLLGDTGRTPHLDAVLDAVGFRRDAVIGWVYELRDRPPVPMRILRAR